MLPISFLVPLGLLGLLTIPLIIWLHFRRERRRRVAVPSLLFWQHMPNVPDGRRRRHLPITLLLFLHLLIAALLGIALSQPQWLGELLGSTTHQIVIIDTSTSMAAAEAGTARLDLARQRARDMLNDMTNRSQLTLITAGPQAHLLATGGIEQRAAFLAALDDLSIQGSATDMVGALTLAQAARDQTHQGQITILSDTALPALESTSAVNPTTALPGMNGSIEWITIGDNLENRAVVAFNARPRNNSPAGDTATLVYARMANYGSTERAARVRLSGDDRLLSTRDVSLPADGHAELTWTVPPGVRVLRVELDGEDALPLDDQASLSLARTRPGNILLVSATPQTLQRALSAVPGTTVRVIDPGQYASSPLTASADMTVFDGTLPATWPAGGVLVVNPPEGDHPLLNVGNAMPLQGNESFAPTIQVIVPPGSSVNPFEGLSIDSIQFESAHLLDETVDTWTNPLLVAGNTPLILRGTLDQSDIIIWTFDLASSNLTDRLAFPLLMARTVRDLTPTSPAAAVMLGDRPLFMPGPRTDTVELVGPDGSNWQVAAHTTAQLPPLQQTGLYSIIERSGDQTVYTSQIAVNAGSPLESDLRPRSIDIDSTMAQPQTASDTETAPTRRDRQPIWLWLALAAFGLMMIEWVYVHR